MSILRIVQYTELKFRILFNNRYHYSKDQPIDCCNSSLENLVTLFMQTSILQTPNTKNPLLLIQLPSKHPNVSRFYYACNSTRVSEKVFKTNQQVSNSGDGKLSQTRTYSDREIEDVSITSLNFSRLLLLLSLGTQREETAEIQASLLRAFFSFQNKSIYRFSETTYAKMKTTYRVTNNRKVHL